MFLVIKEQLNEVLFFKIAKHVCHVGLRTTLRYISYDNNVSMKIFFELIILKIRKRAQNTN